MNNLITLLKNYIEDVEIIPAVQGAIEVRVEEDCDEAVAAVVSAVADAIYDYGLGDVQITTNIAKGRVHVDPIDPIDPEESEDED